MYACMYLYMYVYIYMYMYMYMYMYLYIHIYVCQCICVCVCVCVCDAVKAASTSHARRAFILSQILMYLCVCARTRVYASAHKLL